MNRRRREKKRERRRIADIRKSLRHLGGIPRGTCTTRYAREVAKAHKFSDDDSPGVVDMLIEARERWRASRGEGSDFTRWAV